MNRCGFFLLSWPRYVVSRVIVYTAYVDDEKKQVLQLFGQRSSEIIRCTHNVLCDLPNDLENPAILVTGMFNRLTLCYMLHKCKACFINAKTTLRRWQCTLLTFVCHKHIIILGYDVKLHPAVLHLLSSLCRSLRCSLAPLRYAAMPMTINRHCCQLMVINADWCSSMLLSHRYCCQYLEGCLGLSPA